MVGDLLSPKEPQAVRVLGIGENGEGQVTGFETGSYRFTTPFLIPELDGRGVTGILAAKESSLAWDEKGLIYEWGGQGARPISPLTSLGERVLALRKGDKHYLALTPSGAYLWGQIHAAHSEAQYDLTRLDVKAPTDLACGARSVYVVADEGRLFVMGANDHGQCGLEEGRSYVPKLV